MSPNDNGGRVSTREFYNALLDQNKQRADMETRLGEKIDLIHSDIATNNERFISHDKRISTNASDIKKVRNLNTAVALLASTVAGILGVNR